MTPLRVYVGSAGLRLRRYMPSTQPRRSAPGLACHLFRVASAVDPGRHALRYVGLPLNAPVVAVALATAGASRWPLSRRLYSTPDVARACGLRSHSTVVAYLAPERLPEMLGDQRVRACLAAVVYALACRDEGVAEAEVERTVARASPSVLARWSADTLYPVRALIREAVRVGHGPNTPTE